MIKMVQCSYMPRWVIHNDRPDQPEMEIRGSEGQPQYCRLYFTTMR